ncbi:hypothetical protein LTR91_016656 [Friedmanniomyces endolithicus]|uniref:Uncharacterized protein n=1 Tax=Friedmanniomyces endolithicus TaxID=329885 RepID=A0AAN6K827_9PEZI|nr:hypothetical protein LTR59_013055 [Friedmanniomyces endolithicus]KAK0818729.1 hypothetical protein LTR38_000827 [Friedmanniomyces endolithicus]KAK0838544.1 hypothetical protein LTR03_011908 [Friedmanniomyces endolithicus]KAK0898996.1 hypothetical protein LTR02_009874 [Friedmanniomyces endolithicus]KAK0930376.1 hypothetical protein LTR57_001546 [Friedmanniomyces endolithicus]
MAPTTRASTRATGVAPAQGPGSSGGGGGGRKPGGGGRKPTGRGLSKPSSRRRKTTKKAGAQRAATPPVDAPGEGGDDDQNHPEAGDENGPVAPGEAENPHGAAGSAQEAPAVEAPVAEVPAVEAPAAEAPAAEAAADEGPVVEAPAPADDANLDAPAEADDDQAAAPDHVLASIRDTVRCEYGDRDAGPRQNLQLTGELKIRQDPNELARLAYNACFYLNLDPAHPTRETLVSTIDAWRIEKRTVAKPKARDGWIHDYLSSIPKEDVDDHWSETWQCLRALYTKDGTVKASNKAMVAELRDHGLMFIEMIHTIPPHAQRGLLRPMLTLFRSLLQQLPEWYAFDGLLVLVPAQPAGDRGDVWENSDQVEAQLTRIYTRADEYVLLVRRAAVGKD